MSLINVNANLPKKFGNITDKKMMKKIHREMELAHKDALQDAVRITKAVMEDKGVRATGKLIDSVEIVNLPSTYEKLQASVVFTAKDSVGEPYAYYADKGRRKGTPPPYSDIKKWAEVKIGLNGLNEREKQGIIYGVIYKIASEGTKGHNFITQARQRIQKQVWQKVNRRLNKLKI